MKEITGLINNTSYATYPSILSMREFEQKNNQSMLHCFFAKLFGVESSITLPLHFSSGEVFAICFYSRKPETYSSADNTDIDMVQEILGKSKKLIISEHSQLDAQNNEAFWKMYDEYELKRKKIERQRFLLIKDYADKYETLDAGPSFFL